MSATDFSNWDFSNYHVQQELSSGGQFVSAETSLIASGAPTLNGTGPYSEVPVGQVGTVYPIGLIENAGLSQSKQLQKIFEIGSSRSYFIPGRVIGSVSMGRIFYYGPSILRVLYAYYYNDQNNINIGTVDASTNITLTDGSIVQSPLARLLDTGSTTMHQLRQSPGEDYMFVNLASDLFHQAFGLAFYFKDANFNSVGAFYLENTYIQGHQFSISSGSVLIMEGVSAQYDRIVPIKLLNA
jgi:hypothetical protein